MRRWVYVVFGLLVFSTQAGQLPLTVNELGLMLRTGYSSQSLLQELSKRQFADTLDEAKEATLIKAGASEELIAALKSGAYSLSPRKPQRFNDNSPLKRNIAPPRPTLLASPTRRIKPMFFASELPSRRALTEEAPRRFRNFSKTI